ncbi:MAG TPA: hypothetical protein VK907_13680 [Phnomibacter sp.]|nr:hypothetical protein [Phnomibacter sp.]
MERNEITFEATPETAFRRSKKKKMIWSGIFLLAAMVLLVSGIMGRDAMAIIGGVIFTLSNSFRLWDDLYSRPIKLSLSNHGIWMQQKDHEISAMWDDVKKAVYNGRYLDLYVQSSLRECFDLQPFSEGQRAEILGLTENYLSGYGLAVKHLNNPRPVATA